VSDNAFRVRLPARPESVGEARRLLGKYARELGFDGARLDDVLIALSEAVGNVVRHAYPDRLGEFEAELSRNGDGVQLIVRDWGCGRSMARSETAGAGFGSRLIDAVCDSVETRDVEPSGTEVRMTFRT
jgi:anti-sigma regulatory factor (Ser/Thr protein kinase)